MKPLSRPRVLLAFRLHLEVICSSPLKVLAWNCLEQTCELVALAPLSTAGYRNIFNKVMYYTTLYVSVTGAGPRFGKGGEGSSGSVGMEVPHWDGSRASRGIGGLWDNCLQKMVVFCIYIILHDV